MPKPLVLLKLVAQGVLPVWGPDIAQAVLVPGLLDMVRHVWTFWGRERDEKQRQADLRALAQAPFADVRQQCTTIAAELAGDRPAAVRRALVTYLSWVPTTVSQALQAIDMAADRRPVTLREAEDLLRFLPARMPHFRVGDRPLAGVDLELVQLLGVGGFGEVWKAVNPHFDGVAPVALKFCLEATARDRLLRHEAAVLNQAMRHGKHPGIVPLLRTYLNADPPCLEYEYVEGGDLGALIHRSRQAKNVPVAELATKVLLRLAEIMAFAHRLRPPIVHRDLKPANILVQRAGGGKLTFRITDFGIGGLAARHAIDATTRQDTSQDECLLAALRGAFTPLYASPQQMRGEPPDPRDDVYALGVVWHQFLTGDLATGRPGGTHWPGRLGELGAAPPVVALLGACFEDNPAHRPADAGVLAERITALLKAGPAPLTGTDSGLLRGDLALEVKRTLQQVTEAHQRAASLADNDHDYAGALRVLGEVPEHLREPSLFERVRQQHERVQQLDQAIREAVRDSRFGVLASQVADLLELQPQRDDLRRLLAALPTWATWPQRLTNSIGMEFALIPAGTFLMGSPESEAERSPHEGPPHRVALKNAFYLGIYPVTQKQYLAVMGRNPSQFDERQGGGVDHPVEMASWKDAARFCKRLSALPAEQRGGRIYRLPTEAEWEYACRAGTPTPFSCGRALASHQANFNGSYPYGGAVAGPNLQATSAVGIYPPNAFGLYDMHGNIWEWCADYWDETYYFQSPPEDPPGPTQGVHRVLRGGSWYTSAKYCRSAARSMSTPETRSHSIGFRVALDLARPG